MSLSPDHPNGAEVAKVLLRHGARADVADKDGRNLLDTVTDVYGLTDLDIFDLLLDRGCSPVVEHQDLLEFACEMNSAELLQIALKHETVHHASMAMSLATEAGSVDTLRILLRSGANPNLIDSDGDTPLTIACAKDTYDDVEGYAGNGAWLRREIVRILLANGANPAMSDSDGLTPLQLAAKIGDQELMGLLRSAIERRRRGK